MKMEKYCLSRKHSNLKWYFSLTPKMATNTWDNYFDALKMKLECLFVEGRLYEISLSENKNNQ
jgi:hypothetical protein